MFIYLYGNLVSAVAVRNDEQLGLRSYQLDFYHSKNLAEGDLDFLLDYQPEIRVSTLLPEEIQKEYYSTTNRIDQPYPLYLSANWTDNTIPPSQGRTEFTEEEEAGYAVVLPSGVLPNGFHAPSEITLWVQSFTAIGAHSLMNEHSIFPQGLCRYPDFNGRAFPAVHCAVYPQVCQTNKHRGLPAALEVMR